ncbi:P-loop containing nucleoside triphosphate hydrolase protein [Teratosphaeria nubilosa]|uniref:P-loop containing nucleoside triphosphate hydrolase protein n=1 Tax=Teratosphaeria nubilosa TaxID=161662 RepID=A0A6G1LFV8_9PEZI|nr:P-loop containing nucleoside triphosphate hydrolase protein [Teratosphaeria nubilosa]
MNCAWAPGQNVRRLVLLPSGCRAAPWRELRTKAIQRGHPNSANNRRSLSYGLVAVGTSPLGSSQQNSKRPEKQITRDRYKVSPFSTCSVTVRSHLGTQDVEVELPAPKKTLRPYQEECIRSVLDYLEKGERRLALSLATGSGKTVIFSHLIDRVPLPVPGAHQTLVLAHKRELVTQGASHCSELYPHLTVEIEMGRSKASGLADITVASVPSLKEPRLFKYDPSKFKLILADEAHHAVAPSWLTIFEHFGLSGIDQRGHVALVGVSATLERTDGLSLGKVFDHIVYHKDYLDMIKDDWLADMTFTTVKSGVDLSKVKAARGDYQTGSLSRAVNNDETNNIVVGSWMAKATNRRSTLVFCVDVAHVAELAKTFRRRGVDARSVVGDTPSAERDELLRSFKNREYPVLLNCNVFTEGTDIPNIDCVLLARPTRSRNLLVQMIGRGLRKHEGKQNCHVIDMVSATDDGIATTPTLFGLDPDEIVDNAKPDDLWELKTNRSTQPSGPPHLSGDIVMTDYDSVQDLIQDTSGEQHIRQFSPHAWVQVGHQQFCLSGRNGDLLNIKEVDSKRFEVIFMERLPADAKSKSPYMRPRCIAVNTSFNTCVRSADTFAKSKMDFAFISKRASWRNKPATEKQIQFLNGMLKNKSDTAAELASYTMGRISDMILKLKQGAKGRFSRNMFEKLKTERLQAEKAVQQRRRESQVKVGPIVDGVSD